MREAERGIADDLRRNFRAADARIQGVEDAGHTQAECALKCAKLEDQLEAMRKEVSVARAVAEEGRRTIAGFNAELVDGKNRTHRF